MAERIPIPASLARAVRRRDSGACRYCQHTKGPKHLDHVVPHSRGGPDSFDNLVVACAKCNLRKGAATWEPTPLREHREIIHARRAAAERSNAERVAADAAVLARFQLDGMDAVLVHRRAGRADNRLGQRTAAREKRARRFASADAAYAAVLARREAMG